MAKKRANGEGTVRQLPSGKWQAQYMDGWKPDGRKNVKTWTRDTQRKALKAMQDYIKDKENGLLTGKEITFAAWADEWIEQHQHNISPTTYEGYKYTLRRLKDHFGRKKLADIKTKDVERFLIQLKEDGFSDSEQSKCKGMLFQIFNKAMANDLVIKNPVAYADKIKREPAPEKEPFTLEEIQLLMERLPENKMGWTIRLMLGTGMRPGEMMGLEPKFIAEDGSSIEIRQASKRLKGSVGIGPPKSLKSIRKILVPENIQYCARLLRDTDKRFIWESPKKPGSPCNPSYFSKLFKEAIGTVEGVRVLTPHSCRHTFISQMQALGVSMETIQSIAGHADMDMTRHYLHVEESVRKDAARRMSEAFSKKGKGTFGNVLDIVDHLKSS